MAQESKVNAAAKAREAAAKKRAEARAKAENPIAEEITDQQVELTEEDVVKAQIKAKEEVRVREEAAGLPAETASQEITFPTIKDKPEAVQLQGGKWAAKLGKKILIKGSKEKVDHYIDQL